MAIVNYQLPVSTYRSATEESVDEVFRRINSSGRKLSLQEIRQAGVVSDLANLVRRISAGVRGDASLSETLPLAEMPKISITNRDLPYGIASDDVFWVKNGILDREAVRESRDEELVLDMLLDVILDPISTTGSAYQIQPTAGTRRLVRPKGWWRRASTPSGQRISSETRSDVGCTQASNRQVWETLGDLGDHAAQRTGNPAVFSCRVLR